MILKQMEEHFQEVLSELNFMLAQSTKICALSESISPEATFCFFSKPQSNIPLVGFLRLSFEFWYCLFFPLD